MIVVVRYIDGVSLNGLEYLLDAVGNEMMFENEETARLYLCENGYADEDIESLVFEEIPRATEIYEGCDCN